MHRFFRCIAVFIVTALLCASMQILSTYLPREAIQKHVAESTGPFEPLKSSRNVVGKDVKYKEDIYTDSIILNMSVPYKSHTHLQNAFSAQFSDNIKTPIIGLLDRVKNWDTLTGQYLRYWHGYTVPMRLLLTFVSYRTILIINVICFAALLLAAAFLLQRRFNLWIAFAFVASLFIVGFAAVPFGLQFVGVFYIAAFAIVCELLLAERYKIVDFAPELFVVIGTVTVWIDFLTAPLVTLGLPLLVALLLADKSRVWVLFSSSFAWVLSFATFWVTRWVLAAAMYPQANIKANVADGLAFRFGKTEAASHKLSAVAKNLAMIFAHPATTDDGSLGNRAIIGAGILALLGSLVLVLWFVKKCKPRLSELLPFAFVGAYPILWYLAVSNHSFIHAYFTYRSLAISFFALACIAYCITNNRGKSNTFNNDKM